MTRADCGEVLLIPGLWVPAVAMSLFAHRLAGMGYAPRIFAYRGRAPLEANIAHLARCASARPMHFVGHSLGGLLVLETLNRYVNIAVGRAVLIAAPVRGCLSARRFARVAAGRWLLGGSLALWAEGREARWRRPERLGVLAGTRALGLGRLLGGFDEPNDGVVRLSETAVEGASDQTQLPLAHSELMVSERAARITAGFLASGRFADFVR